MKRAAIVSPETWRGVNRQVREWGKGHGVFMKVQPEWSKKGEIEFRKKLAIQQVEGVETIPGECDASEIEAILAERMRKTLNQMARLMDEGAVLSPYIEIGAERCQRSLVMENDMACAGAALDISFDMLKSCAFYAQRFGKSRMPLRVCADAYHLPFISGSVPFVFCYETLHHFPDPEPIIEEIHRVLTPGGTFFFEEEPYRKILHLGVCRARGHDRKPGMRESVVKRAFRHFFVRSVPNELEYGIIENHDISIRGWLDALRVFEDRRIWLSSLMNLEVNAHAPRLSPAYLVAYLGGGTIGGVCRKAGDATGSEREDIEEALACPACLVSGVEARLGRDDNGISCCRCGAIYPQSEGVLFLFAQAEMHALYPEIDT